MAAGLIVSGHCGRPPHVVCQSRRFGGQRQWHDRRFCLDHRPNSAQCGHRTGAQRHPRCRADQQRHTGTHRRGRAGQPHLAAPGWASLDHGHRARQHRGLGLHRYQRAGRRPAQPEPASRRRCRQPGHAAHANFHGGHGSPVVTRADRHERGHRQRHQQHRPTDAQHLAGVQRHCRAPEPGGLVLGQQQHGICHRHRRPGWQLERHPGHRLDHGGQLQRARSCHRPGGQRQQSGRGTELRVRQRRPHQQHGRGV